MGMGDIQDMAITSAHLFVAVRGVFKGQNVQIGQWFRPDGAAFLTADAVSVGEAFWNDIKTDWRALHAASDEDRTASVFVSEPGSTGAFGEFAVPSAEQLGTRSVATTSGFQAAFAAGSFRETVATRATRPGQKRIWGLLDEDSDDQDVMSATYLGLLDTFAAHLVGPINLGAPVATGVLQAEVVHQEGDPLAITEWQDVTGYVLKNTVTSQVSRKVGHGS